MLLTINVNCGPKRACTFACDYIDRYIIGVPMNRIQTFIVSTMCWASMSGSAEARNLIVLDSGFENDLPWAYIYDADSVERAGSIARVQAYSAATTQGGQTFIRADQREFDCSARRSRSLGSKDFAPDGSPDGHVLGAGNWEPTLADSNADVLLDVSCGNEEPDHEHSLGDAEPIPTLVQALQAQMNTPSR